MKSISMLSSTILVMAFAASTGAAIANSLEYQCRAAVRAEMRGPDCRLPLPPNAGGHCNIPANADVELMDNKIHQCMKRGGPGRQAKVGS
jgi:hypothetical protein